MLENFNLQVEWRQGKLQKIEVSAALFALRLLISALSLIFSCQAGILHQKRDTIRILFFFHQTSFFHPQKDYVFRTDPALDVRPACEGTSRVLLRLQTLHCIETNTSTKSCQTQWECIDAEIVCNGFRQMFQCFTFGWAFVCVWLVISVSLNKLRTKKRTMRTKNDCLVFFSGTSWRRCWSTKTRRARRPGRAATPTAGAGRARRATHGTNRTTRTCCPRTTAQVRAACVQGS